jgi:hypothetical protein
MILGIMSSRSFGQKQIYERIEVVNQEILVRVFSGHEPVSGLAAGNFILYEDGQRVEITSCRQVRRSLAGMPEPAKATGPDEGRRRLFLFMLWFNEESKEWPRAWDYFLSHVYRPGDRVILSDGVRALEMVNPATEKEKLADFFEEYNRAVEGKKLDKNRLVSEMENDADNFYDNLISGLISPKLLFQDFKVRYLGALNEYRLARLKGYAPWLERLADALKAVEAEKWVLVFLQNERLPLLNLEGRLVMSAPGVIKDDLVQFMEDCQRQITFSTGAMDYSRDMQSLFVGANATYHLFLCDTAGELIPSEHLRWSPVFSSWERAFRRISADTGGRVSNTTRLGAALEKAASSEDIYYVLTYQPADGKDRKRDLKVEVDRPGLKAVYSRKLELSESFPLKISDLAWGQGVLQIAVSDFQRAYGEGGFAGLLRVSIRAEAQGGKALIFEKHVLAKDPAVIVEMALNFPDAGLYRIEVDVEDLLSGNRVHAEKGIDIAAVPTQPEKPQQVIAEKTAPSAELAALLDLNAGYCRRLKEGAFRFFCLETVEERTLERNPLKQLVEKVERRWRYDYQVVGAGGKIKEQRLPLQSGALKAGAKSVSLDTRFSSLYSVFMPITLLAPENREKYNYRLAGHEKLKKRHCTVVEVMPLDPEVGEVAQGRAWVDEEDGSVLKIEIDPRGVTGSQALDEASRKMSARLKLTVTHWYLVRHDGMRFPSETEFIEAYDFEKGLTQEMKTLRPSTILHLSQVQTVLSPPHMAARQRQVEFYRLSQVYGKYRFFTVDSREEIQNLE